MNFEAAEKVIRFYCRRGGFDAWWEDIDRDTRQEIKEGLAELLSESRGELRASERQGESRWCFLAKELAGAIVDHGDCSGCEALLKEIRGFGTPRDDGTTEGAPAPVAAERQGGEDGREPGQRAQAIFQKARYGLTGSGVDWETASPANRRAWAAVETELAQLAPSADAAMARWVPVSERLPANPEQEVLVYYRLRGNRLADGVDVAKKGSGPGWFRPTFCLDDTEVSHWRPLPAPPREGE